MNNRKPKLKMWHVSLYSNNQPIISLGIQNGNDKQKIIDKLSDLYKVDKNDLMLEELKRYE